MSQVFDFTSPFPATFSFGGSNIEAPTDSAQAQAELARQTQLAFAAYQAQAFAAMAKQQAAQPQPQASTSSIASSSSSSQYPYAYQPATISPASLDRVASNSSSVLAHTDTLTRSPSPLDTPPEGLHWTVDSDTEHDHEHDHDHDHDLHEVPEVSSATA